MTQEGEGLNSILRFDKEMKDIFGKNLVRRDIMGCYGELLVANEFIKNKINVKRKGNLAGCDLLVNGKKIEVRTSELKEERAFPKNIKAWGWKLQTRDRQKKPRPIKYDFIILVKLNDNWKNYELFMLSKKEVEEVDLTYFSGYQTVARVIYLFKNFKEAKKFDKHEMITEKCVEFNKNPKKFLIKFGKIK